MRECSASWPRKEHAMPTRRTVRKAKQDLREGKSPTTAAGEFVHEEIEHVRQGKHGARSTKQAIAIGLSKARRAGVKLPPPAPGEAPARTRASAKRAYEAGQQDGARRVSKRRSKATVRALKREGRPAASSTALARQARAQAKKRTAAERSESARRGARTRLAHQTHAERSRIARKAAKSRAAGRRVS